MYRKLLVGILGLALVLGSAAAVAASTGKLKVSLINQKGVAINGTVVAKKGTTVKKCTTSGGTCTLTGLAPGTWAVVAKTSSGAKAGPTNKSIIADKTVNMTVQISVPITSRR